MRQRKGDLLRNLLAAFRREARTTLFPLDGRRFQRRALRLPARAAGSRRADDQPPHGHRHRDVLRLPLTAHFLARYADGSAKVRIDTVEAIDSSLAVVDGDAPFGVETDEDAVARRALVRTIGYKPWSTEVTRGYIRLHAKDGRRDELVNALDRLEVLNAARRQPGFLAAERTTFRRSQRPSRLELMGEPRFEL